MGGGDSDHNPKGGTVRCVCGATHRMTATALSIALQAFIDGDAQRVDGYEVKPMCVFELLENAPESAMKGKRLRRVDYAFYA